MNTRVEAWQGESELVKALMIDRPGQWVHAAAELDYRFLTDTTRPIRQLYGQPRVSEQRAARLLMQSISRVDQDEMLINQVEQEVRSMADLIPHRQRPAVAARAHEVLGSTVGHFAVCYLAEALAV